MSQPDPFAPPSGAEPVASSAPLGPPAYGVRTEPYAPAWTPVPAAPLGLATTSIVLAGIWTAVQVIMLATSFTAADQLEAAGDPGYALTVYDTIGNLQLPVMVGAFVVSCLWLQGSRAFAQATAPTVRHKRGPVWVWLGWIVPIVSLWFPFQVVRDVCTGSGVRLRNTLGPWWGCWLAAMWLTNQAAFSSAGVGSRDPSMIPFFELLATPATIVAFVMWVRVVRAITEAQKAHVATAG